MTLPHYEVIPALAWRNAKTGATASLYGAVPYTSAADKADWSLEDRGFTIRNNRTGAVGVYGSPFATKDEADARLARLNAL